MGIDLAREAWTQKECLQQLEALDRHAIVSITDADGTIIHANDRFCAISGYTRAELVGHDHRILKSVTHSPGFFRHMWKTIQSGKTWTGLICNQNKNGRLYWVNSTIVPIKDDHGEVERYISIRTEVTPLVEAQIQVYESERDFRAIFDNMQDVFCRTDSSGKIVLVSPSVKTLLQFSPAELVGRNIAELWIKPQQREAFLERLHGGGGKIRNYEARLRRKDGQAVWIAASAHVRLDDEGREVGVESIFRDVSDQKRMEQDLIKAKVEAESANRAKSTFLASVSHELRTPLNSILGFSELLKMENQDDTTLELAGHIYKSGRHLLTLINELLDLARIETGNIDLCIEAVELHALLQEAHAEIAHLASRKGIALSFCHPEESLGVLADRIRLHQVLLNLISNAVKYNRPNGSVSVSAERIDDRVRISVVDTGIGLSLSEQEKLFLPYTRFAPKSIEGTGIGLTITKNLTEAMNGAIGVGSEPGIGSTFWIEFPAVHLNSPHADGLAHDAHQDEAALQAMTGTVLHIEDKQADQLLLRRMLQDLPHLELITASSPEEGLAIAARCLPDLVFLDINMPGADGFEVLKLLRGDEKTGRIPIVALSANAMPEDFEKAKQAGFDYYLAKPCSLSVIRATVRHHLRPRAGRPHPH